MSAVMASFPLKFILLFYKNRFHFKNALVLSSTIFSEFGKTQWSRKHQQSKDFSRLFYYRPSYASCFPPKLPIDWFVFA
jgi:hypothetical protein